MCAMFTPNLVNDTNIYLICLARTPLLIDVSVLKKKDFSTQKRETEKTQLAA
jgi:hypothetical protein